MNDGYVSLRYCYGMFCCKITLHSDKGGMYSLLFCVDALKISADKRKALHFHELFTDIGAGPVLPDRYEIFACYRWFQRIGPRSLH